MPSPDSIRPFTVLVAEDDPVSQKVLTRMLDRFGLQADVVPDGAAAVAAVRQVAYDLVLMDIMMPEVDGIEATRRIRRLGDDVRQPLIVAVTANVVVADRDACFAAGMNGFIPKPVRPEVLESTLLELSAASDGPTQERRETDTGWIQAPRLDPDAFEALRASIGADDRDFLALLVSEFLDDARKQVDVVRHASTPTDAFRAGHTLQSTAATFGAMALSRAAAGVRAALEPFDASTRESVALLLSGLLDEVVDELPRMVTRTAA